MGVPVVRDLPIPRTGQRLKRSPPGRGAEGRRSASASPSTGALFRAILRVAVHMTPKLITVGAGSPPVVSVTAGVAPLIQPIGTLPTVGSVPRRTIVVAGVEVAMTTCLKAAEARCPVLLLRVATAVANTAIPREAASPLAARWRVLRQSWCTGLATTFAAANATVEATLGQHTSSPAF